MALLKAELLHARIRQNGLTLRERLLSSVDLLGRLGCMLPRVANAFLKFQFAAASVGNFFGFAPERPLPPFAHERFDRWFAKRETRAGRPRPRHALGRHVRALSRAGHRPWPPSRCWKRRALKSCCRNAQMLRTPRLQPGQPRRSRATGPPQSRAAEARQATLPIIFLEPSCYSMFARGLSRIETAGRGARGRRAAFCSRNSSTICWSRNRKALIFNEEAARIDHPCALPRQVAGQHGLHVSTGAPAAEPGRDACSKPAAAAWRARSACWNRNTNSR